MNLKHLTDDALLASTDRAVQDERSALSVVLHHLREVDRRRLYSKLKYKSLFDYAVKHQKYSEGGAARRISAMKTLKELPELAAKIDDGSLNLTNIGMARSFFAQEKKAGTNEAPRTAAAKLAVFEKLENVSKVQALAILESETGLRMKAVESYRDLGDGTVEMKSIVTKEAHEIGERLKGLLAHSHPNMSNGELIEMALKALQEKVDPLAKAKRVANKKEKAEVTTPASKQRVNSPSKTPGDVPAAVSNPVWIRDDGKCANCGSFSAIQEEHVVAVALGGESTVENVKLLCRSCNQRSAIEVYGVGKMDSFLREPASLYFGYSTYQPSGTFHCSSPRRSP